MYRYIIVPGVQGHGEIFIFVDFFASTTFFASTYNLMDLFLLFNISHPLTGIVHFSASYSVQLIYTFKHLRSNGRKKRNLFK